MINQPIETQFDWLLRLYIGRSIGAGSWLARKYPLYCLTLLDFTLQRLKALVTLMIYNLIETLSDLQFIDALSIDS